MNVCEKHFEDHYVTNVGDDGGKPRKRLYSHAVPTLRLPAPRPRPPALPSNSIQNLVSNPLEPAPDDPMYIPDEPATTTYIQVPPPYKVKLEPEEFPRANKLVQIKEESNCLTVFVATEDEDEDQQETLHAERVQPVQVTHVPQRKKRIRGNAQKLTYSTDYQMIALELYFRSPLSYRVFHESFSLPRVGMLYRLCLPKTTELSQYLLNALKLKVEKMSVAQKQCVICIGTLSLTPNIEYDAKSDKITGFHEVDGVQILEPTRTALIVAVRGIFHNWKQAIAFAFLSNHQNYAHVKLFIDVIIGQLLRFGLNVRAIMTDVETDKVTAADQRTFDSRNPYIRIDGRKIYYIYDPLYLIKDMRDKLFTHNFVFYSGLVARWQHIVHCYQHDHKKQTLRLAPKLSFNHIRPIKDALDELSVARDIFSNATATALSCYIDLKELPPSARDTVQWIVNMTKVIEMLNFSSTHPPEDKSAVFTGEAAQVDFLVGMLLLFEKVNAVPADVYTNNPQNKSNTKPEFAERFRITINAILLLFGDLKTEKCWYPVVGLTRDCLIDFFIKVRQKYGGLPTAQQLVTCIKTFPIFTIFEYSCSKSRKSDLGTFLFNARQMPDIEMYEREAAESLVDVCADDCAEFGVLQLPTENRLDHFALYLLHKGYQRHARCDDLEEYTRCCEIIKEDGLYIHFIPSEEVLMASVPHEFVEFIEVLDIKFKDYFKDKHISRSIAGLLGYINNVTYEMPCACFPIQYVKQLYLRLRLHLLLEYYNKVFRSSNTKTEFVINDL